MSSFYKNKLIYDPRVRSVRTRLSPGVVAIYVHIDDFEFLAATAALAEAARQLVRDQLHAVGFLTTLGDQDAGDDYVGLTLVSGHRWQPTSAKLALLDRALGALADAPVIHTGVLHSVLALFIWCGLTWRLSLSCIGCLFKLVEEAPRWLPLLPSARMELRSMRGMLPFVYSDMSRAACPLVVTQDAAVQPSKPYGADVRQYGAYCLAACVPPLSEVRATIDGCYLYI